MEGYKSDSSKTEPTHTEMNTQPEEINELLKQKYSAKRVLDEFGFTGQYNLSSKDLLDIIIDLKSEPVAPIDKTLTVEQYIRRLYPLSDKFSRLGCEKIAEDYANLRVEQAKEEWKKEKEIVRHSLSCNHCGDYYGININHQCYKCLQPLF